MERLLNHYDKEYMKMAMLKHEETFRHQVCELHRLYRIQKILMKSMDENPRRPDPHCPDQTRPLAEFNVPESRTKFRVSEIEDDQSDLELTLGSRRYYQKKIEASEPELPSDSGTSFSSSSTGSSQINGKTKEQKWGLQEMPVKSQDRLNSPPWLFQALSLNLT